MIDHLGLTVTDIARSKAFYVAAFAPLGVEVVLELDAETTGSHAAVGFGVGGKPTFWIGEGAAPSTRTHVAFTAPSREVVDAFHRAALAAGGVDNGAPGLRPHYHAHYYGAFALDPDGYNVEAVCHLPQD